MQEGLVFYKFRKKNPTSVRIEKLEPPDSLAVFFRFSQRRSIRQKMPSILPEYVMYRYDWGIESNDTPSRPDKNSICDKQKHKGKRNASPLSF